MYQNDSNDYINNENNAIPGYNETRDYKAEASVPDVS